MKRPDYPAAHTPASQIARMAYASIFAREADGTMRQIEAGIADEFVKLAGILGYDVAKIEARKVA